MFAAPIKRLAIVALLPVLAGCSTINALTDVSTPLNVFDLRAPVNGPTVLGSQLAQDVIVELPTTSGVLDTDRILIRPNSIQAQYLPEARWGDEVPVMLQTLMVRSLVNTNGLRYVGRRPLAGSGDFAIVTELVDFQAEVGVDGVSGVVSISMTSRLVRELDASIVASRTFNVRQDVGSTSTGALVSAFDQAAQTVMLEFADWTLSSLGRPLSDS